MSIILLVSATEADTDRLVANGPRRDFLELARATGGAVVYREGGKKPRGLRGKLLGPHVRQAWRAARSARAGDTIFADGEHIGLPLAVSLALLRKRTRVVMLGHYVSKPWKRRAIRVASWLKHDVSLIVHSAVQERVATRASGGRWDVQLLPYQVDTEFWRRCGQAAPAGRPRIVAVGSEHRDYATLIAAVDGPDVELVIAAGSHWARESAGAGNVPANVVLHSEPLAFAELRELYASAAIVAVPLEDVANQSGITVMLEAMAMGAPVAVTASRGQRECVAGPLMRNGREQSEPVASRGPAAFGITGTPAPNGVYVAPGDIQGWRDLIAMLLAEPARFACMGENGRRTVESSFTIEQFTQRIADVIAGGAG